MVVSKTGSAVMTNNNNNNNVNNNNNNNSVKSMSSFQNKSLRQTQKGNETLHSVKNGCIHGPIKEINKGLIKQLMHNSRAFESIAILLSYCTNDVGFFLNFLKIFLRRFNYLWKKKHAFVCVIHLAEHHANTRTQTHTHVNVFVSKYLEWVHLVFRFDVGY